MKPAFSRDTKEYLSRLPVKSRHCRLAELHALLAGIGDLGVDETGQLYLLLQSENLAAVRRADYLLAALSGRRTCCSVFVKAWLRKYSSRSASFMLLVITRTLFRAC